jgi:hypothetical protein
LAFADDTACPAGTQALFQESPNFSYWPSGLTSPFSLQSDFVKATVEPYYFICPTSPLPSSMTYGLNQFHSGPGTLVELHNIKFAFQTNGNLVVYNTTTSPSTVEWISGYYVPTGETCGSLCSFNFQGDGNLVEYYNGAVLWTAKTQNVGHSLVFLNKAPWIEVKDASGAVVWSAPPKV